MSNDIQVGDFAENKLHGYITFIFVQNVNNAEIFVGLIVDTNTIKNVWAVNSFIKSECTRTEIKGELKKIVPTKKLIDTTKEYLIKMNTLPNQIIDNLTYIELLNNLNEQEKELSNETNNG